MKIEDLLRGPSKRQVKVGKTEDFVRIGCTRNYPLLRSVKIAYTPVTFSRRYLFPWVQGFQAQMWHLRVTVVAKNGRSYEKVFVSECELKHALDYAYINGVGHALMQIREEVATGTRMTA